MTRVHSNQKRGGTAQTARPGVEGSSSDATGRLSPAPRRRSGILRQRGAPMVDVTIKRLDAVLAERGPSSGEAR